MVNLRQTLIFIGILLLLFGAGFLCGRCSHGDRPEPEPQIDTVWVKDTTTDVKPQGNSVPAGFELVPVGTLQQLADFEAAIAQLQDSLAVKPRVVVQNDTVYVEVPMSKTFYTDHRTYECEVYGYGTEMLWHKSFQETAYITQTVPVPTLPKLAISPDFSAFCTPKVFGIGAGVKLDVWSGNWRFSPSLGYTLISADGSWSHGPAVSFSAGYNFIIK